MKIQLIRNATLKIKYAGNVFVIDPFLAPKHTVQSFAGVSPNPTVELPCAPEEVLEGIEMVIISHLHPDHFDPLAQELLPNDIEVVCQPGDDALIRQIGFNSTNAIATSIDWRNIHITRTPGRHGTGVWEEQMGNVSGFIFEAPNEPRVYLTGDTIYYNEIKQVLSKHSPDVIVTNSGGAEFPGSGPIIMDGEQTVSLCLECPDAKIVATHLEALDHCTVTREGLRELARNSNIPDKRLLIPKDGETLNF